MLNFKQINCNECIKDDTDQAAGNMEGNEFKAKNNNTLELVE